MSGEPRDLKQLSGVLADARDRGLIDADVLAMLEGVLQVSEIQVRDVMVPRSQMVVVHRDDPPEKILPVVIESGHSRFPVVGEDRDEVAGILDLAEFLAKPKAGLIRAREDNTIPDVLPTGFVKWPWKDNSVDEIHMSHTIEHFDAIERCHITMKCSV